MEEAAVHRMATSITQLTHVKSLKEIQSSADLLEKASLQLKNVPGVLPQYIIDLECATRHLHQLLRELHKCTASASREVREVQKALLLPRTRQGSSTSSEEQYEIQAIPVDYDEHKSISEDSSEMMLM